MLTLDSPVTQIYLVGPQQATKLARLGIENVRDLLFHFPRTYEDRRQVDLLSSAKINTSQNFRGIIDEINNTKGWRGRKSLTKAIFSDKSGSMSVVWYNQPYLTNTLKEGDEVMLTGKVKLYKGSPILQSPQFEKYKKSLIHSNRLTPIYPQTEAISSKWLRSKITTVLFLADQLPEFHSAETIMGQSLMPLAHAVKEIHFPTSQESLDKARERLSVSPLMNSSSCN